LLIVAVQSGLTPVRPQTMPAGCVNLSDNELPHQIHSLHCGIDFYARLGAALRADAGDAYAQAVVSIYYAVGYKTEKNVHLAAKYALSSAEQIHPLGIYRFAAMVENGDGFEKDVEGARRLKTKVFDALNSMVGDPYAITALGVMFFRGEAGLVRNQKEAARLYKIAADMGYAPAQYNYAACLISGQGVPKNRNLGIEYWEKSSQQGYEVALKGIPE
jgi:TPR repeat protein